MVRAVSPAVIPCDCDSDVSQNPIPRLARSSRSPAASRDPHAELHPPAPRLADHAEARFDTRQGGGSVSENRGRLGGYRSRLLGFRVGIVPSSLGVSHFIDGIPSFVRTVATPCEGRSSRLHGCFRRGTGHPRLCGGVVSAKTPRAAEG